MAWSSFFREASNIYSKSEPKGTLKSIQNHKKSSFGLEGSPEASQDHTVTAKVFKKLLKRDPRW